MPFGYECLPLETKAEKSLLYIQKDESNKKIRISVPKDAST
jgi:hypothetical protein